MQGAAPPQQVPPQQYVMQQMPSQQYPMQQMPSQQYMQQQASFRSLFQASLLPRCRIGGFL